jgi:hypothetical protein
MRYLLVLFISLNTFASLKRAAILYGRGNPKPQQIREMIINLVDAGYPMAAMPFLKEYIVNRGQVNSKLEKYVEEIMHYAGVKPFQVLSFNILKNAKSPSIKYVLAKKYFARNKMAIALKHLRQITSEAKVYPYAAHMKAVIHSTENRQEVAAQFFKDCIRYSERYIASEGNKVKLQQYKMNRDYCLAGLARTQYARRDFKKAELAYLDIQKSSEVWPEILFEEAWNSFYKRDYNRTLGKLVTYKAPVFEDVFKPEAEVLVAMSYLSMCHYNDAKKAVDSFYSRYLQPARGLKKFLKSRRRDYNYYYKLAIDGENKRIRSQLLSKVIRSISREQAYKEIKETLKLSLKEGKRIKQMGPSRFQKALFRNLQEVASSQKVIMGSYIRNRAIAKYAELYRAFQDMSYIKLEVLAQRKRNLYKTNANFSRQRGG